MPERLVGLRILVVDANTRTTDAIALSLRPFGCDVLAAADERAARAVLERGPAFDGLFISDRLTGESMLPLVQWALMGSFARRAYCVMEAPTCDRVVRAMRAGCNDVIEEMLVPERVRASLLADRAPARRIEQWRRECAFDMLGNDPRMGEVFELLESVSDTNSTVLITGETGTGKEVAARVVHRGSRRANGPFVALNCTAIPEALIEAELFGYVRGAFTGAATSREGRVQAAHGGTLFLDEIGDMPLSAQAKLLRVIQERSLTPLGSDRTVAVDVRIVAATHRDLAAMVERGEFRADLYYRLSVVAVELPALRDRSSDILPLAHHFLTEANAAAGRSVAGIDTCAQAALVRYAWPGNVRQLANAIERAVVLKRQGGLITAMDLSPAVARGTQRLTAMDEKVATAVLAGLPAAAAPPPAPAPMRRAPTAPPMPAMPSMPVEAADPSNLKDALDGLEEQLIRQALQKTGGNRTEAAALLGLNRTTLVEKLRKYAI